MIRKALLAATVATGLIIPTAQAGVYLPPKPAIIKPENIEFSKNLLAMPFTMGMLVKRAATANIQFVGYASASAAGAMSLTSLTGGIGSAPATGDIVIVGLKSSATSDLNLSITSPAGYTEIADIYGNALSFDTNLGVYYKVQGSTPDTSITVPSITSPRAIAYVLRNVNSTTPLDATATTAVDTSASNPNPPSITTVTNNAVVVAIGANGLLQTGHTYPSGYSNYAANTGGLQFSMKLIATAGAENPAAYSVGYSNQTNESWCAVTLALRPA